MRTSTLAFLVYAFRRPLGRALGLLLLWFGFVAFLMLAASCTPPTEPSPPDLTPSFQQVYQGAGGGGHGGGAGGASFCSRPTASLECLLKAGALTIGGGAITACSSWGVCLPLVPTWGLGAQDYLQTPDCRSCGQENAGTGTGRSIGPTAPQNLPPGSPPDLN